MSTGIVLLDTDVVSYILKGDSRAASFAGLIQGNQLAISFMTVAELYQWAAVRKWGQQRLQRLEQALLAYLTHNISDFHSIANLDVRTAP